MLSDQTMALTSPNLEAKVELKPGKYKLEQIIDVLSGQGINLTYNTSSLPLEDVIDFKTSDLTVKQVLELIQKTLPVEYQVKGEYVILKKKKSNAKYNLSPVAVAIS